MMVRVIIENTKEECCLKEPANLLDLLQRSKAQISAPCGGKGTCGKCRVYIDKVGEVLACQTVISDNWLLEKGFGPEAVIRVRLPEANKIKVAVDGISPKIICEPLFLKGSCRLSDDSISDQRPYDLKFMAASGISIPLELLPELIRHAGPDNKGRKMNFVFRQDKQELVSFLDNPDLLLAGAAFDIGTTTIAGCLYDLETGSQLGCATAGNPQTKFGADVISRIGFSQSGSDHLSLLRSTLFESIQRLLAQLLNQAGLTEQSLCSLCLCGNTIMTHILCNLDPAGLAAAPFIPVSTKSWVIKAADLGFHFSSNPYCIILPGVSAYIGSDITAGVLACGMFPAADKRNLLLDIGTNGEIVLSANKKLTACSAAAGPAFEAANISCGVHAGPAAVDKVTINGSGITLRTIDPDIEKPAGLCGTGLVSAVAEMLRMGLIDETGRFETENLNQQAFLRQRFGEREGQKCFYLDKTEGSLFVTQKDVRELQNAKAAIAAGVSSLLNTAEVKIEDLDQILIAGGFGNYIEAEDALTIGLLPKEAAGKIRSAGNTAVSGTAVCLLNDNYRQTADQAAAAIRYLELSADSDFNDLYIEAMFFPQKEEL